MTLQEQHNLNLQNLNCCISTKFDHYSRLIQLGSNLKNCKLQELILLNILFETLKCIPNCLTDLQIQNLWKYVSKLCGCNYKYDI